MKLMSLVVLMFAVACSSTSKTILSSKAKDVEILVNRPGPECQVVGKIVGENEQGSVELARNHARNQSAKLDATAMLINQEVPNGNSVKVYATAYQCE